MSEFSGKIVIVTGAGSGIGKATAIKLASLGATLALADINKDSLKAVVEICNAQAAAQRPHSGWAVDVRYGKTCDGFVAQVAAEMGAIHHAFINAGVNPTNMPTEQVSDDYYNTLVDTNLKGVFNMTRAVLPYLQSGASIVTTSSTCGLYPVAGNSVYCATKYAVIGFAKSVALEVGERGIRVNVIAPGLINTPTNAAVVAGKDPTEIGRQVGLRRMGQPEEIADVVAFLFSDKSRYMNGSVVEVDGGLGVTF